MTKNYFFNLILPNILLHINTDRGRVAYRYSGIDRNRYSFRKEPVFTRFVENRY